MGNCCNYFKSKPMKTITILLVGLDNAGKTTAVKELAGESLDEVMPTNGFSVFSMKRFKHKIRIYDLGGGPGIRGIWQRYFVDVHGVIFVVDASDFMRFSEVKQVLESVITNKNIAGKPLLILANKQDRENALDEIDIIEQLDIEKLVNTYECPTMVECSSVNFITSKTKLDEGIQRGFEWLLKFIINNYNYINDRVVEDMRVAEEQFQKEMRVKIERIKERQRLESFRNSGDVIESYTEYQRKLNGATSTASLSPKAKAKISTQQQTFETMTNHSDKSCSTDFPPLLYHPVKNSLTNHNLPVARPKSAVQMVKEQLQISEKRKRPKPLAKNNKTAPITIYNNKPQSARSPYRHSHNKIDRQLKSAEDLTIYSIPLPNSTVPFDERFDINLVDVRKLKYSNRPARISRSACGERLYRSERF